MMLKGAAFAQLCVVLFLALCIPEHQGRSTENTTAIIDIDATLDPLNVTMLENDNSSVPYNDSLRNTTDSTDDQHPPKSIGQRLSKYWTFRVAFQMYRIYPIVLFVVGLIGNGMAFLVFIQKRMRRYSSYIYLSILAIFDQLALLGFLLSVIGQMYVPSIQSVAFCKIATYLQSFPNHVTSWLVVMVTIERFIATSMPLKAGRLCTVRRAFVMSMVIVFIGAALNITVFWTVTFLDDRGTPRCETNPERMDFFHIWQWVDIIIFSFIPCIVLFVFNIAIVILMNSAWKRQRRLTNSTTRVGTGVFSKQITVMLLLVSFVFLLCTVPASSMFLYKHIEQPENGPEEDYALFIFLNQVMQLLHWLNHCFNIVLYAISGNRFRSEMKNVFLCKCGQRIQRTSTAHTYTTQKKRSASSTVSSVSSAYEMAEYNGNGHSQNGRTNSAYQHDECNGTHGEVTSHDPGNDQGQKGKRKD